MPNTALQNATRCPDRDVLLAFYSGELPPLDIETVGSHLATCETCLAFLDSQNSGKIFIPLANGDSAKSSLLDDTAILKIQQNPAFQRMVAQVKQFELSDDRETRSLDSKDKLARQSEAQKHPEKVGPYFIAKHLGRGGFANVYKARGPDERVVAIKVPRKEKLKSPTQIEDFLREAQTAAALDHPHIVPVYDFGREAAGSCYVVMKHIEGQSLEAATASESMSWERIAEICAQIAGALDYAHNYDFANKKGLIHRDIKPANILLDKQGNAYIADFGLAIHEETQHDLEDQIAGTYAYMSPEQVRGFTRHLDARTDIWSLGVVMYELLTRQKPFPESKNLARMEENLKFHPIRPPRSINSKVPGELERICLKCLEKEVAVRSPSAAGVEDYLRAWLRGKRRSLQIRSLAAVAAIVGIVITSLLAWAFASGGRGSQPADHKEPPAPAVAVENPRQKNNLLVNEPVIVFGHPRPDPFFSAAQQVFTVGPTTKPWIARVDRRPSEPVHLHATVSLKDWIGSIGLAWQFHDRNQPPGTSNRWLVAEFNRPTGLAPCRLLVEELTLSPGGEFSSSVYYDQDIVAPPRSSAELDLRIEDNLLTFSLGDEMIQVTAPVAGAPVQAWLEPGELTLALTGKKQSTTFQNVILELAPGK